MTMRQRGFTIIELMTAVAVIAILAALAIPSFRSVVENGRIRAQGQSLKDGLALARTEAIRLNTQVEFVMSDAGWKIQRVSDGEVLQQASGKESTTGLTITTVPDSTRVTFNAFGSVVSVNPSDGSAPPTQIDIESASPSGSSSYRPLRLELSTGGSARLCDPSAASTEPKACLTSGS